MGITLDLACGTGTLTILLKQMGVDIYGIDSSAEMLSAAQEKALENNIRGMLFYNRKCRILTFTVLWILVYAHLTALTILLIRVMFKSLFKGVFFMNPHALFIFDVNTLYKHQKFGQ